MEYTDKDLNSMDRKDIDRICDIYKITTQGVETESLISQLKDLYEFAQISEPNVKELSEETTQFRITPIKEIQPLCMEPEDFVIQFSPKQEIKVIEKAIEKENTPPKQMIAEKKLDQRIEEIKEKRKQFSFQTRNKIITDKRTEQLKKTDKLCRDNYQRK